MVLNSRITSWTKYLDNFNFNLSHFFCTLPPSKQWEPKSLSQVPKAYTQETLKKDPSKREKYIKQVLMSYRVTPNLATAETPFFLVYGRDPNLPLHQILEPVQRFLGDPESSLLNLKAYHLSLAIARKTLDENCFRTAQKTMDREPPSLKIGDRVYFKNK